MFICQKSPALSLGLASKNAQFQPRISDSIGRHQGQLKQLSPCHPQSPSFSTATSTSYSATGIDRPYSTHHHRKSSAKERQRAERDQLIKSLKESPGKRDARNFLKHFDTSAHKPRPNAKAKQSSGDQRTPGYFTANSIVHEGDAVQRAHHNEWRLTRTGVNLGILYEPTKAIQNTPVFAQQPLPEVNVQERSISVDPLHLALVKLRQPQMLDDATIGGIALTLGQMARLGLNIAVVVDCDEDSAVDDLELTATWEKTVRDESARIVDALEEYNEPGAFEVGHALSYSAVDPTEVPSTVQIRGGVEVKNNHLLLPPIEDGIIPVIPPIAYDADLKKVRVHADDVLLALTREFANINVMNSSSNDDRSPTSSGKDATEKPSVDRIIILDPLGGIPSETRPDGAHVFINLEAEYHDVQNDLRRLQLMSTSGEQRQSYFGSSNISSRIAETQIANVAGSTPKRIPAGLSAKRHIKNLDAVQRALQLLPPSSSAIIITPAEAAISSQVAQLSEPSEGVRTRRSKNPLIHNLLTDKPMISSSLPSPLVNRPLASTAPNPSTFLKKGIPLTMIPDPRTSGPWRPPSSLEPSIELGTDPRIDFPRLVHLIEDSFRRKLDAEHYLQRIRGRVAGIIIVGNYEGGAICTWEPARHPGAEFTPGLDHPTWIPYLDKFAVLTQSQGSGGVADIVWGALTRSCFPNGVVWRSRTNNPVNKWYFERAVGMWNLPGGQWTMFWTTEGVVEEWRKQVKEQAHKDGADFMTRWDAYVKVCKGVVPSWADGKSPD
ncbi:N-acetylglutamate synthase [Aaosphaeria arxii CBS 175.79]|uniref:Amino-acid acetyltransferase, mitochondrial n=1 Tax=Aaosphaeria arxii CBS 175.79 TaxID=1450172 RepID=A0A6A5Y3J5_9PLEO|nr:N-acetylglutamate synthase [Aaosphaeria arxii CBS 175.79]KAF2019431.1 N-acetylglutamate synthase [Aaosphaeria arxii CBS 175.79]